MTAKASNAITTIMKRRSGEPSLVDKVVRPIKSETTAMTKRNGSFLIFAITWPTIFPYISPSGFPTDSEAWGALSVLVGSGIVATTFLDVKKIQIGIVLWEVNEDCGKGTSRS